MNRTRHGGYALVLVIGLVAAVSVLGLSYIDDNSVTVTSASNLTYLSRARYLAESGVEQAIYWLGVGNPPVVNGDGYWPGATNQLVDGTSDYYDVTVVRSETDDTRFTVTSTGYCMRNTTVLMSRRVTATVTRALAPTASLNHALLLASSDTTTSRTNQTYNGSVHSNGSVINYATINGNLTACGLALAIKRATGSNLSWQNYVSFPDFRYNHYTTYTLDGQTYTAATHNQQNMNSGYVVPNTNGTNPYKVVNATKVTGGTRDVKLKSNLALAGTLVIDGDVHINGSNISITPQAGFPAIVATGNLYFSGGSNSATINGAIILGGTIAGTGSLTGNSLTVNGPMRMSALSIANWSSGGITVNLTAHTNRAWLYNFTIPADQWPQGRVDVQAWSEN